MSAPKKNTAVENKDTIAKEKKCFAIMPIADHPDYDSGHFSRVYNHLIKPACKQAGFKAVRADDAKASHMIMFDILKNIVECDMAICDLSSKNANVFYELGLRQAFNRKTILITDGRTHTPFDITGFRYVKYDHTLRVDSVMNDIDEIAAMLMETDEAAEDDVNSIVKLLKIQPASVEHLQLNEKDSLIFEMIQRLDEKMTRIEILQKNKRQENSKEGAWFRSSLRGSDNQHVSKSLLQAVDDYMEENSQKNKINIIYTHEEKDKDLS
ncbi:hypothetical protein RZR38_09690 [Citrobacter freundii]|uniref:hypothetical protein n=1 Tax=Citrobacter freundii TaxID=546 RepID=UPI0015AD86BD|nr:hypothetical protein [Citrobacter freundii]MDV1856031.1 hypothetical protein [Citrobacter freundii]MEB0417225.1 hypothetical protein [Citrobacter freundii]MEB0914584.1 hypothetical protein [Citrobacter freundii]QLD05542.1 hypothetical protein HXS83_03240 [Citrobacter freundii]